jgi:hypothetical protein
MSKVRRQLQKGKRFTLVARATSIWTFKASSKRLIDHKTVQEFPKTVAL